MVATPNIMEALATLKPEQLREVAARTSFLLGSGTTPATVQERAGVIDTDTQMVWDVLAEVVEKAGNRVPPLSVFLLSKHGSQFRRSAQAVMKLVRGGFRACRRPEQLSAVRLILALVALDCERNLKPIRPRYLSYVLSDPAAVVDRHFPGYRDSGLLPVILRRMTRKTEPE